MNVTASAVAASLSSSLIPGAAGLSLLVAVLGMTFLLLVLGEISPKTLAVRKSARWAATVSGAMTTYMRVVSPLAGLLKTLSGAMAGASRATEGESDLTGTDMVSLVELGRSEGLLGREAEATLSLLALHDTQCIHVMRPRSAVDVLRTGWSRERFRRVAAGSGHTRFPLLDGSRERVAGYVDVRSLVLSERREEVEYHWMPSFPENARLETVLRELRASEGQMGAVFDEYGDWIGIVTIRDIMDHVLNVRRLDPTSLPEGVAVRDGGVEVPATMKLDVLSNLMGCSLRARWAETCAGLLEEATGRIPAEGEEVVVQGVSFRVLAAGRQGISRVLARRLDGGSEE